MNHIGIKIINNITIDYYHLRKDNKEFLIVNSGGDVPTAFLWTDKNEFVPYNEFGKLDLKYIKYDFKSTRKTVTELGDNGENKFFKHVYPKSVGTWTAEETNELLSALQEFDLIDDDGIITEEMALQYPVVLNELIGYKVYVETDGDHRNDGQMVDYTFYFTSPSGKESSFSTEMCLMVGWNHSDIVNIL